MDEMKNKILNSIDDEMIPDLSYSIKTIYLDRKERQTPWYKRKLTWGIAIPTVALATTLAIVLPVTVFNKGNSNLVTPIIPIVNQNLQTTENTYSIGTLSLANAISANAGMIDQVSQNIQKEAAQDNGPDGGAWGGWDGWGRMHNGEDDLKEVLRYGSQYMYTVEKMLNKSLNQLPDEFVHESQKDGSEKYKCIFDKDQEFECSFDFTEKLIEEKNEISIAGVLGIKNNEFVVEGSRDNIQKDKASGLELSVKFEKKETYKEWWKNKNPILSFKERNDVSGNLVYDFSYSENYQEVYNVMITYMDVSDTNFYPWVKMEVTKYYPTWSPYVGGYYNQAQSFVFSIEKDQYGNLVLYLLNFGTKLFIDVRDENGRYYYYLSDLNSQDPFGDYGKH